ncbi:MAG: SGNH/GDSL hydrolase family protein [Chthoniobacterales bacterium]|nr:SGNH/GDSL hydrolase family protein [Chthoniobacterales bacterium]
MNSHRPISRSIFSIFLFAVLSLGANAFAQAPAFSQVVVFGDSLSDDGNVRHLLEDQYGISYPGGGYNYSDGRFTNSADTDPNSELYAGTWHEQLERDFLHLSAGAIINSLDGGTDYAFGGATTGDGTSARTVISNPDPFVGGELTVDVDNVGKQVGDYIAANTPDANALYIVWGGGNDFFDDNSLDNVPVVAANVAGLVQQLAEAGARSILVPNVPPLGLVPHYKDDPETAAALNAAAASYRDQLNTSLDATVATLAGEGITITLYRFDVYGLFYRLAANPEDYDFTNVTDSDQGGDTSPDQYLFWDDIHPTTAGHFQIASGAFDLLSGTTQPPARALNFSSRLDVGVGENVLIDGLIVSGPGPKTILFRGLGPSLAVDGTPLANTLADPKLQLFQGETLLRTNDNWKGTQEAAINDTGLPPDNDLESAMVVTLDPGTYTIILSGTNNSTGNGLVEAYDLDTAPVSTLTNTSTRGFVQTDDNVLIGGFIVGDGGSDTFVVRAIGPSLADASITNPLADPTLDLYDANGVLIKSNDNWRDAQESLIQSTGLAPTNDAEAAIVRSLAPGNYTAVVRGKDGGTGVALVEVYNLK